MSRASNKRASIAICHGAVLGGLLALALASGSAHADEPTRAPADSYKDAAETVRDDAEKVCRSFGPGYRAVGTTGVCAFLGGSILVHAAKEFTNDDIVMIGQRIPTLFNDGAGVPIVFYHADDVSKQTRYPAVGAIASAHMMLRGESDLGLLRGFIRVTADTRTHYDYQDGDVSFDLRKFDNSYYLGALEEAWVQLNGLKLGIQPSLFGFNRLPSVVTPGYTSIVTTMAASYTHRITPNMSVSIAAEDPHRRNLGDGILARPTRPDTPDIVGMFRVATPSTLFHFSGAIHHADDRVMKDFTDGDEKSVRGWAWSFGLQTRLKWEDILGTQAAGQFGRATLTVANATGALGYLGIPMFAPDYIVGGDGKINKSSGWSAVASYEHMLAPRVKLNLNASYFDLAMRSSPEQIIPDLDPNVTPLPGLEFEVDVRGAVLQTGLEFMPMQGFVVGVEGGYTLTEAKGRYVGIAGDKASVGFPHVGVYLRKTF
jgi:hypothetical protein